MPPGHPTIRNSPASRPGFSLPSSVAPPTSTDPATPFCGPEVALVAPLPDHKTINRTVAEVRPVGGCRGGGEFASWGHECHRSRTTRQTLRRPYGGRRCGLRRRGGGD